MKKHNYAICLAGGKGLRMGTDIDKVLLEINGKNALKYSLEAFNRCDDIHGIILVCPKDSIDRYKQIVAPWSIDKLTNIIQGGNTRGESVYNGLLAIQKPCEYVLIHDGARVMLKNHTIKKMLDSTIKYKAALAGRPVVNTIKESHDNTIIKTVDRDNLWEVYTPQGFEYSLILQAYENVINNDLTITDDATAMELIGHKVHLVDVGYNDIKLTSHGDIKVIEALLRRPSKMKVGIGYDTHKLVVGRPLILGGIKIDHNMGLLGHSDADVLVHAIMDAMLGAAGLGDIGEHFPDNNELFKDIYSIDLLKKVNSKLKNLNYVIGNIDCIIICQKPKISPYKEKIIDCLSGALGCDRSQINIKATTNEGLGFTGRGEGISAQAIASLEYMGL